jgi:hypothetical protein
LESLFGDKAAGVQTYLLFYILIPDEVSVDLYLPMNAFMVWRFYGTAPSYLPSHQQEALSTSEV